MTQTAGSHLTQPLVGGDTGTWGTSLNLDMTLIDRGLNSTLTVNIPDANVVLTADGTSADQSVYAGLYFTGALTANRSVTLPANVKIGYATNATTGGFAVILTAGATQLVLDQLASRVRYEVDASNNVTSPIISSGDYSGNSTGYVHLSGTMILQWGRTVTTAGFTTITFPTAFRSGPFAITATPMDATAALAAEVDTYTTTTARMICFHTDTKVGVAGTTVAWIAIGV